MLDGLLWGHRFRVSLVSGCYNKFAALYRERIDFNAAYFIKRRNLFDRTGYKRIV